MKQSPNRAILSAADDLNSDDERSRQRNSELREFNEN